MNSAMSVDPAEYLNYVRKGVPPVSARQEIITGAKVYPENKRLSDEQIKFFVEKWPLEGVTRKNDIAFVFIDAVKGENNLILFTEEEGTIYELKNFNQVGKIHGKFNLTGLANINTQESNLLDIDLDGQIYQIIR